MNLIDSFWLTLRISPMTQIQFFLKGLLLSALFTFSMTNAFASDTAEEEKKALTPKPFVIHSLADLAPLFDSQGIELGPNTALYFDNDETIVFSSFNLQMSPNDDLPPLTHLSCPDLGRTYIDLLKATAELLHKEDSSTSLEGLEGNILQANVQICRWNTEYWRHGISLLECEPLTDFLAQARKKKAPLKICSGLPLHSQKLFFFNQHQKELGFQLPHLENYGHQLEAGDYLHAPLKKGGKLIRILQDCLVKPWSIDTIILVDNAPSACQAFLEGHSFSKLKIIAVQYDYFRELLTPEKIAEEYKLWLSFLQARKEKRAEQEKRASLFWGGDSPSSDGYDSYHTSQSSARSSLAASHEGTPKRNQLASSGEGELLEQEEEDDLSDSDETGDYLRDHKNAS